MENQFCFNIRFYVLANGSWLTLYETRFGIFTLLHLDPVKQDLLTLEELHQLNLLIN